ncbi:MAG: site-2 protease family protein [Dehalococcoidia bacterium]|jgi:Zn-dependent protease|nr:MAG: Zn-dependent protease (includes SpoIVFB) [Chloroflexota bacterium]|tara:strand:- start:2925 stop:3734 length:810 start_codon:yes stop_codon:yes gene_type:complete
MYNNIDQKHILLKGDILFLVYFSVLKSSPLAFIIIISALSISLLLGLVLHEIVHGFIAYKLGDPTAKENGRLSLNPLAHLDPFGSSLIFFVGFGWAKPVPVNPNYFKNPIKDMAIVALAGPLTNIIIAVLSSIPFLLGLLIPTHPLVPPNYADLIVSFSKLSPANLFGLFFGTITFINATLAVFNLIPIPPLDGFKVLLGILPEKVVNNLSSLEKWGPGILIVLVLMPFLSNGSISPLWWFIAPLRDMFINFFASSMNDWSFMVNELLK